MARTIVAGFGGTDGGAALAWAVEEAEADQSQLVVCHVCPPASALARLAGHVTPATLELADPALARAVGAARTRIGGHRVSVDLRTGPPGAGLVAAAEAGDLLVVGPGTRPHVPATTVHHVLRHATTPTVVARASSGTGQSPCAQHVVVGVDGGDAGRAALEFGFAYADRHGRPVAAVHVTGSGRDDRWYDGATPSTHVPAESGWFEQLAADVEPWSREYPDVRVKSAVLAGPVVTGLLRAAAGARLLVLGRTHHNPVARAITGDHARMVADAVAGPVALVPGTVLARTR